MIVAHRRTAPGTRDGASERGATLALMSVAMLGLLVITALVVDLGMVRSERTTLNKVADAAALAAAHRLSGRGGASPRPDPPGACEAAWVTIQRNLESRLPAAANMPCSSLGSAVCDGSTKMRTVTASGSAPYRITIDYPVPNSEIADPAFVGGVGTGDGTQCERMRVSLQEDLETAFAGTIGIDTLSAASRAVARGGLDNSSRVVPAFLMLERTGCVVLTNSVGGAGNNGIVVRPALADQGGRIHVDTDASECGSQSTNYAIYGTPLSSGGPSIRVIDGTSGARGIISSYSVTAGSTRNGAVYPGGLSHPVEAGPIVSRQPFDDRFNSSSRPSITDLHSTAYAASRWTTSQAVAAGYTITGCPGASGNIAGTKVFVNCPGGVNLPSGAVRFNNATHVIFNGAVSIPSGSTLAMPRAKEVVVKGCDSCGGSGYYSMDVRGSLLVNTGSEPLASASCANREGPGAGGSTTETAVIALVGAPLLLGNRSRLCQTTVYMAANRPTYQREAVTLGPPNCAVTLPCPVKTNVALGGHYVITGNDNEWTAPNQTTTGADASHPFEDLALWSESGAASSSAPVPFEIKSGGSLSNAGVFFSPNGIIEYRSPASGTPRNAQLIARTMNLRQGTLEMRPVQSDAVPVPLPGAYALIR